MKWEHGERWKQWNKIENTDTFIKIYVKTILVNTLSFEYNKTKAKSSCSNKIIEKGNFFEKY